MIRFVVWLCVVLLGLVGCGSGTSAKSAASAPSAVDPNFSRLATETSRDVGTVVFQGGGGSAGVIVLEERHGSVLGQLELAVILMRLHDRGVHLIGLEGAMQGRTITAPSGWRGQGEAPDDAFDIALEMLLDAEIDAAEFAVLVLPNARVVGVEAPELYAVRPASGLPEAAYLLQIAASSLPPNEAAELAAKSQGPDAKIITARLLDADPWVRQQWAAMQNRDQSVEQVAARLRQIEERARAKNVELDPELRDAFAKDRVFFETASRRSRVMADTLRVAMEQRWAALIVGGGHGEGVGAALQSGGMMVGRIRPKSFGSEAGVISEDAFRRRLGNGAAGLHPGSLGSALCGVAKKPPPALATLAGEIHVRIMSMVRMAARTLRDGGSLAGLKKKFEKGPVRFLTLEAAGKDVVANLGWTDSNRTQRTIWVSAQASSRIDASSGKPSREAQVLALIASVQRDNVSADEGPAGAVRLGSDVRAIFSADEAEIRSQNVKKRPCPSN